MDLMGLLRRHDQLSSFFIMFLLSFILHRMIDISFYPFDSSIYWGLSAPSVIVDFPEVVRGYFYPLLLAPVHALSDALGGNGRVAFQLFSSIAYSYLLTGPIANFFLKTFGGVLSFMRRIVFVLLAIMLYPGLFLFPLSDLPALLAVIISVAFASRAKSRYWWIWLFLSGVAVSAAYNIRTIYLFSVISLLLLVGFVFTHGKPLRGRFFGALIFLLGVLIVAVPQMLINKRIHGTATPLVLAVVKGKPLMAQQLYWGVVVQRYETYLGKDAPAPSLYYRDPAGIALRNKSEQLFSEPTIFGYISLVLSHPFQFIGVYGRHLINGLDVRDGIVYSEKLSLDKSIVSFLCFCLLFFCLLIFFRVEISVCLKFFILLPFLSQCLLYCQGQSKQGFSSPYT